MPFINISIAGDPLTETQKQQLIDETTRLMHEVMRKAPDLTAVRIDEVSAASWAIGRSSMAVRGETAVHMDVKVTAGTNTAEEKAEMISQGMTMLKDVVGNAPEASYIVIHDLAAEAWGYDGRTQQARAKQKKAA